MSSEFVLTSENYHGSEANWKYVSASQYKDFCGTISKLGCEACAMAKLRGEFADVETTALLVGSYVDAYFEGTLATFAAQHPEIYSSRGKTAGELKSEYKQATIMIDRAVRDPLFMQFMEGQKQVIMTGEIEGVPVKIKIDSFDGIRITDLKTVKSITETFYAKDLGQRLNFIENWGYDIQGAIYREIVRQNTGETLPLSAKIRMTEQRIKGWIEEYGIDGVYVSFSGGKDSTVLLYLARQIDRDIKAMFVDTGLEYPEIREFVKSFHNVDWERPKMTFRQVIEKYGYPFISKEVSECVDGARKFLRGGGTANSTANCKESENTRKRAYLFEYNKLCGQGKYAPTNAGGGTTTSIVNFED